MCGRYGFSVKDAKEVYERFDIVNTLDDFTPRWNIAPGQMNPVITVHSPKRISRMFWGLIPFWAKEQNIKFSTINARDDKVATSPVYRKPFRTQRCLIPATGFFEPDKIHFTDPPYPWHYFKLKKQEMFSFAGLYDIWKDQKSGKEIYSYTIITTSPNDLVGKYHPRMPVILKKEDEDEWVNPDLQEVEKLMEFLKPYPSIEMEEWHVADEARNPRNDKPEIIKPVK